MKYYSHDDVYSSLEAMTPLSIEQINVTMNSLTPVSTPERERIRMELWNSAYLHFIKTNVHSLAAEMATTATAAFDKQFPNS